MTAPLPLRQSSELYEHDYALWLQPERHPNGWRFTILEHRDRIEFCQALRSTQ